MHVTILAGMATFLACTSLARALRPARSSSAGFRGGSRAWLNRIMFEQNECMECKDGSMSYHVNLPATDYRSQHITQILKPTIGDKIRCGVADVGMTDEAVVLSLPKMHKEEIETQKDTEVGEEVKEISSSRVSNKESAHVVISLGPKSSWSINDRPKVDLVLALPRPLRLERLLPVISCMGVGRLVLIGASKVEKGYFGSHLMREPDAVRELLVEGLSQCEVDCLVPEVTICKSFWDFTKKVDLLFPSEKYRRLLAHPLFEWDERDDFMKKYDVESAGIENSRRVFDMDSKMALEPDQQIVVCVGPEGGWERREVAKFLQEDFQLVNLGERILRTDMAVPAILSLIHERLHFANVAKDKKTSSVHL